MDKKSILKGAAGAVLALAMVSTTAFAASVTFKDVPGTHWAYDYISRMADKGIVAGVGGGNYDPEGTVTNAAFLTMISRQFYGTKDGSDVWYAPHLEAAKSAGVLAGTLIGADDGLADNTINRYDMAQIMYNVMGSPAATGDTSKIADWASVPDGYRDAVSVCYSLGLLTGVDQKGTFDGQGVMTRAQAATAMDRLITAKPGGSTETPTPPQQEQPAEGTEKLFVTPSMVTNMDEYKTFNNGVFRVHFEGKAMSAEVHDALNFKNSGYSKLTFTITVHEKLHVCVVDGIDSATGGDRRYSTVDKGDHLKPEETRTITCDISGIKNFTIVASNGIYSNFEISNIYLHN